MSDEPEVVIAGAGVAGLTAAILLARAGLRVVCVEPEPFPRARVGESLDWSAPALLRALGLDPESLVKAGVGTYKREIRATTPGGELMIGRPGAWLHRWPFHVEVVTLHVDRRRFDGCLYTRAVDAGVRFVWDHISTIEFDGDRVAGCRTRTGGMFTPTWFIDASGRHRIIARAADIGRRMLGPPRISLWSQRDGALPFEGTMLHLDDSSAGLPWAWEIPIADRRLSIGVVMNLEGFRVRHRAGLSPAEILVDALARFRRFRGLSADSLDAVEIRRFQPFVSNRVAGPNWFMTGEAAAMADPITAIGVTTALRHGSEAARLILECADSPQALCEGCEDYDRRARSVAGFYTRSIEALMQQPDVRAAFGIRWAARAYVPPGFLTNAFYTRLQPTTRSRMIAFGIVLQAFRLWQQAWLTAARRRGRATGTPSGSDISRSGGARGQRPRAEAPQERSSASRGPRAAG